MKYFYLFIFLIVTNLAFAQPSNDTCSNAEPITVTSELTTVNFDLTGAALNTEIGCDGTTGDYADVWFSFIMPFDGNVVIDGAISWNNIGATNSCNGSLLACSNTELILNNISANTNVLLRIFRAPNVADNEQFSSFTIQAFETPTNDTCDASINIPLGILQQQVSFDIAGSIINSNNGCSVNTTEYADVWYDFTMPFDGNLFLDGSTTWNKFEIFDACTGSSLFCGEDTLLAVGLTDNADYKIRVYRRVEDMFTLNFLNFYILAYQKTNNDDCTTALPLNLSETPTTVTTPFLGGSAIENTTGCTSDTQEYLDIWYTFTTVTTGDVSISSGSVWDKFELYNDCSGSAIHCFEKDGSFSALPLGTYYLRVFRELEFATSSAFKDFDISSTAETLTTYNFELESINVFPNPASDYIYMQSDKHIDKIEIFDLNGKRLLKTEDTEKIQVELLQKGVYILKLFSNNLFINKLFIKK
jgi:hypothetical protein